MTVALPTPLHRTLLQYKSSSMFEQQADDISMFTELGLYPQDTSTSLQLRRVLKDLLSYPSDRLAYLHQKSNRLGEFDLPAGRETLRCLLLQNKQVYQLCQCCYQIRQNSLKCCTPIHQVVPLGEATKLFFNDMKYCILLMSICLFVYALYSFITNITASNNNELPCIQMRTCKLASIGLGSKLYAQKSQRNNKLYIIQAYLGLAMICIWAPIFMLKMCQQKNIETVQNKKSPTASDFSLVFRNLPKDYTKDSLQSKLNSYAMMMRSNILYPKPHLFPEAMYDMGFTIKTFNPVRQYYESLKISQRQSPSHAQIKLNSAIKSLVSLVKYCGRTRNFPIPHQKRLQLYRDIDILKINTNIQRMKKLQRIQETFNIMDTRSTRIVFVTFNHTFAKSNLLMMNKVSIFQKMLCFQKNPLKLDIPGLIIQQAPQPEDIIWENIGVSTCQIIIRKLMTYFICAALLGGSFGIMYALSKVQMDYQYITVSLLISVLINIINILLNSLIQFLTTYQKDITTSDYQISICIKITIAQLVNSILLSMISAYYIKKNIYQEGGLVDDVFYFSLLNAFISPIQRLINPYYWYLRIIRAYKSTPAKKLECQSQVQYNKLWELVEFQIGLQYVYPYKTIIYTSFFVSLQPIIIVFGLIGIFLMYFAQKRVLYFQSSRPKPGNNIISQGVSWLFYFSIIAYGLGSLTWTNFLPDSQPQYAFIPNIIVMAIGIVVYMMAATRLGQKCVGSSTVPLLYDKERLFFPTQYDRLNPVTKTEGLKDFIDYINYKKNQIMTKSKLSLESSILIKPDTERDIDAILQIKKFVPEMRSKSLLIPDALESPARIPAIRSNIHNNELINQSIYRSKLENEVQANSKNSLRAVNSQRGLFASTQFNLQSSGGEVQLNHERLKTIIQMNDCPGNQKPGMTSSKFNPIDYIQAVDDPGFSSR